MDDRDGKQRPWGLQDSRQFGPSTPREPQIGHISDRQRSRGATSAGQRNGIALQLPVATGERERLTTENGRAKFRLKNTNKILKTNKTLQKYLSCQLSPSRRIPGKSRTAAKKRSKFFVNFDRTVLRRQKELDAQKKTGDASGLKRSFLRVFQ